jgi:hypothetical protein
MTSCTALLRYIRVEETITIQNRNKSIQRIMILRLSKIISTILLATCVFAACSDTTGPDVGNGDDGNGDTVTEYTINASAGEGGSISPSGNITVEEGEEQSFEIEADEGYVIDDVLVDGDSAGAVEEFTFENVQSNHTIEAIFREQPEFQDSSPVSVDLSYFEDADAGDSEEYYGFNMASMMASTVHGLFSAYHGYGMTYFGMGDFDDATFEDGVWTWEETFDYGSGSLTITLIAEDTEEGREWKMIFSGVDPDTGEEMDDVLFLSGFVAHDGSYGEWNYYMTEGETDQPIFTYSWSVDSEDQYTLSFVVNEDGDMEGFSIVYEKDGHDNTITMQGDHERDRTYIYWNTDDKTGYMELDGEIYCWGSNYQATSCE